MKFLLLVIFSISASLSLWAKNDLYKEVPFKANFKSSHSGLKLSSIAKEETFGIDGSKNNQFKSRSIASPQEADPSWAKEDIINNPPPKDEQEYNRYPSSLEEDYTPQTYKVRQWKFQK